MKAALSLLILALTFYPSLGQNTVAPTSIQDIRLQNSNVYGNQGRVEILYNNTWGTICDTYWSSFDGRVTCRMLGFSGLVCVTINGRLGRAAADVPIWMSRLRCSGNEEYLDSCPFYGWGSEQHGCTSHSDDAGIVCRNESLLDIPEVRVENTTTRSISISWTFNNQIPSGTNRFRFVVRYNSTTFRYQRYLYITGTSTQTRYYANIRNLNRDSEYFISVRLDVSIASCSIRSYSSYYMQGSFSDSMRVRTNLTVRESMFAVRLISPFSGFNFLGRVEVNYNNVWGTVCDNRFNYNAANIVCQLLNYTRAACTIGNARLGRGDIGRPIILNQVSCIGAEILDDCSYSFWNSSRSLCSSYHRDDVGVVCYPDPDNFLRAPEGFNLTIRDASSVTFSWERFNFPSSVPSKRLLLEYNRSDTRYSYSRTISYYSTSYVLRYLPLGITINATITAQGRFSNYGCYTYFKGASSDSQSIVTMETPPSGPPQLFHISVVNCSAIRAEWELPAYSKRNGIVRGYRLMYLPPNGIEMVINLTENDTEYIIGGLEASTRYVVSVLAFTVGDGPRSIHLTATTNPQDICQTDIINYFGINGNGIDKIILATYNFRNPISILCGSNLPGVEIDWFFSNGTKVGSTNRDIHEGHFSNGTTALRFRNVNLCDAGLYSCIANQTNTGRVEQRTFKVTVNRRPPTPARPIVLNITSSTASIAWIKFACSGGHNVHSFNIRIAYYVYSRYYPRFTYTYVRGINALQMNYTVIGLTANTNYEISVQAEGQDSTFSSYSRQVTVTTLPPAPTPPRIVSVELITPDTIRVTWIRSSTPRGRIVYYTVYATPFISKSIIPRAKRQAESMTVAKNFSSSESSGNLTLPQQGVEYHIQITVTEFDSGSGTNRESVFSAVNPNATLFVPIAGLPFPSRVYISSSSNVSLTVAWDAPAATGYTINGYLVEYSAMVEGRSPLGNLISYMHEGSSTTGNANQITLQPLVAQTSYLLKVAALTNRGEGMQVRLTGLTNNAASDLEQFVYFHVRFGPVLSCSGFRKNIEGQATTVKEQILNSLNDMCNCGLTDANIETGLFSCGQKDHQIIYRAHILGTSNYNAINLVDMLQSWIRSGRAYVRINTFRLQLDPTCPSRLDTLYDPECGVVDIPTPPKPTEPPAKTDKPLPIFGQPSHARISAANIGGIFVGAVIAVLLLLILIVFGVGLYCWKFRPQSHLSIGGNRSKEADVTPFAELEEKNVYEEKFY